MRRVVKRFVAGDTLEEAIPVCEALAKEGYYVTLDLLGEHAAGPVDGEAALAEYEEILHRLGKSEYAGGWQPERINISIKLTQLGLIQDEEKATQRLIQLLSVAKQYGNFVRVDMEESACTDRTLAAVVKGYEAHANVGVAIQSMLYRSDEDVKVLNEKGIRMRLVKGAYLEPPEVARQAKSDIDKAYVDLGKTMLEHGTYPAFGTHDEAIIKKLRSHAEEMQVDKHGYEFQMLFGIRKPLQASLKDDGVNVRVYVPYGTSWYPYFSRRLAERPANLLFFIRALFGR